MLLDERFIRRSAVGCRCDSTLEKLKFYIDVIPANLCWAQEPSRSFDDPAVFERYDVAWQEIMMTMESHSTEQNGFTTEMYFRIFLHLGVHKEGCNAMPPK